MGVCRNPGRGAQYGGDHPLVFGQRKTGGQSRRRSPLEADARQCQPENTAYESFIAFAQGRAPDVLIVQEVTEDWRESLRPLHGRYPFREEAPKSRGSGMALYSRFPFERLTIAFPESGARPCILARMDIDGASVLLLSIHPRAPIRNDHYRLRNEMLAAAAECLSELLTPKILVGDLNITP